MKTPDVVLQWSIGDGQNCLLTLPADITAADFAEFEEAVRLQFRVVRREIEGRASTADQPGAAHE